MSTIDTSTWNPDADLNVEIEGIPLNADASIVQTWQVIRILMAAFKGDTSAIQALMVPFTGATASADGASGFVPAPAAGDQNKVLKGDGTWSALDASQIPVLDASKIASGTIDLARIPAGAIERLVPVTDQAARFALTTDAVQLGDVVKETDTGLLYFVTDTAHLDSDAGYTVFTAGTATAVPWSGVTDKPSTFPPSSHAHGNLTNDGKIGSTANLPLITTTSGKVTTGSFGTTANTFCQGNDSRLGDSRTPKSHTHGSITNDGKLGTASRVVVTDGSKVIGVSSVTTTKLGYLTDVTANIQAQIDGKIEKSDLCNWQKSEKAGAVTIYPVPETTLEPTVDFMFSETGPASGDKGPENPSTIAGVDLIRVGAGNKNLFATPRNSDMHGLTATYNEDGSIILNGTATQTCIITAGIFVASFIRETTLTFSANNTQTSSGVIMRWGNQGGWMYLSSANATKTYTAFPGTNNSTGTFQIRVESGTDLNNFAISPQVEFGNTATVFEKGIQTRYEVSLGSTYYGGSVDLATGVMTVTQFGVELDGTEIGWWSSGTVGTDFKHAVLLSDNNLPLPTAGATDKVCSHAATYAVSYARSLGSFFVSDTNNPQIAFADKDAVYPTNDAWKAWLAAQKTAGTPVVVTYPLATPYTVQLSPTQILSLAQPDKYTPRLNTVYTDASAVQVGYQRVFDESRIIQPPVGASNPERTVLCADGVWRDISQIAFPL